MSFLLSRLLSRMAEIKAELQAAGYDEMGEERVCLGRRRECSVESWVGAALLSRIHFFKDRPPY